MGRIVTWLLWLPLVAWVGCTNTPSQPELPSHPELSADDRAAVASIEAVVGPLTVGTDDEPDLKIDEHGRVIVVDLSGVEDPLQVSDAVLEHVGKLSQVRKVYLTNTGITDAGMAHLAGLTELESLYVDGTRLTNAGLQHLEPLKHLRTVICRSTQINTAGSDRLKKSLPNLLITHD